MTAPSTRPPFSTRVTVPRTSRLAVLVVTALLAASPVRAQETGAAIMVCPSRLV